jgi:hypothetical protein
MVCYQAVENNIIYEEGIFIIDDLPELEEDDLPELIHGGNDGDGDNGGGGAGTGEDVGEDVKLVINPAEDEEEDNEDEDSRPTFHINWLNLFINHANNHRDSWLRQF